MKKAIILIAILATAVANVKAERLESDDYKIANHVGVGVGVGVLDGITFEAATCLSKYVFVRAGVNILPNLEYTQREDFDYSYTASVGNLSQTINQHASIDLTGKLGFKQGYLKFDVYPFPSASSFYVTAGAVIAPAKVFELSGHSDELAASIKQFGYQNVSAALNLDDYNFDFDENGSVVADLRVKKFRPYLGVGFGRLIPKSRIGFRTELGVSFWGTPTIFVNDKEWVRPASLGDSEGDIGKVLDALNEIKVCPTIKFSLTCRVL